MIWVAFGYAVLVISTVGLLTVTSVRRVGRLAGTRWKVTHSLCYIAAVGSLIALSNASSSQTLEEWLPLAVFLFLGAAVGLPLYFWSKRELARNPEEESLWMPS